MTRDEIAALLAEENPEALLADGLEDAFVGLARHCGQPTLAVYDCGLCINILMRDGMSEDEAEEYLEFNSIGAWAGEHTPLWLVRVERIENVDIDHSR
jgi:hypothetical protein